MTTDDRTILRELAQAYLEICLTDDQQRRRQQWSSLNSLERVPPPIYIRAYAWGELPESRCLCTDPYLAGIESHFRRCLFIHSLQDDSIFEPWVQLGAVHILPEHGHWGLPVHWIKGDQANGAKRLDPPIKDPEDLAKLAQPQHRIDETATARHLEQVQDLLGDLLPVSVDRAPAYRSWHGDLSTDLGYLRGIEQAMFDMMDRPEWLHQLLAHMRDGILRTHEQAEAAGDWHLNSHQNQAMPYARELAPPAHDGAPVQRRDLWYFCAAQELTLISPRQHDEFMLQYQLPIIRHFGLVAYGCCEDLSRKIDILRQIPNLRRIAVSPMADAARCAEQIGTDYVMSYRPSPADMVAYRFDPERVRQILRRDLTAMRQGYADITLKDVETIEGEPQRLRSFVQLAREVTTDLW